MGESAGTLLSRAFVISLFSGAAIATDKNNSGPAVRRCPARRVRKGGPSDVPVSMDRARLAGAGPDRRRPGTGVVGSADADGRSGRALRDGAGAGSPADALPRPENLDRARRQS